MTNVPVDATCHYAHFSEDLSVPTPSRHGSCSEGQKCTEKSTVGSSASKDQIFTSHTKIVLLDH